VLGHQVSLSLDLVYRRTSGFPRRSALGDTLSSDETATGWYLGTTATVAKQTGSLRLHLTYTYRRSKMVLPMVPSPPPPIVAFGDLGGDRPHALQALVGQDVRGYAWLAAIFTTESGWWQPTTTAEVAGSFEDYPTSLRAEARQRDPFAPLANPPASYRLNLQARLHGKRVVGLDLDLYADVINLFGWGGVDDRKLFDLATGRRLQEGRTARLGIEYRH
jgi:hypothetical protein